MTKTKIRALQWFAINGPVGWFDAEAPSHRMRVMLERDGLIEALPSGQMRVVRYGLSAAGRAALPG